MNRSQRRRLEKQGKRDGFDPEKNWKLTYDLHVPPGLMRGAYPGRVAGTVEAKDEADVLRGLVVAVMNAAGFSADQRAVVGTLAEVINPFSNSMRGGLAYAIIHGQGLEITEVDVKVCEECKAEYTEKLLNFGAEGEEDSGIEPTLGDSTQHDLKCSSSNKQVCFDPNCTPEGCETCSGEGVIHKEPGVAVYTEVKAVQILLPKKFAGINDKPEGDRTQEREIDEDTLNKELRLAEGETIPSDEEGELKKVWVSDDGSTDTDAAAE